MSIYQRGETWWIYIRHKETRIRRSAWTTNKDEAQRIHDELKAELWQRRPDAHTWHEAVAIWLSSGKRGAPDRYRLRALGIPPETYLDTLTPDFLAAVLDRYKVGSHNRTANLITAILNAATRRGWLMATPKIERMKNPEKAIRWLTREEWEMLYPCLTGFQKPLARFALATGLRQFNVTHLRWDHVDLSRRVAWVDANEAKGKKPLTVPLSDDAIEVLHGQIGQSTEWVFPYRGKPVSEIKTAWAAAVKKSGIKHVRWHDLRHTWASWHIMAGTPIEVLQKLGGWADLTMVQVYAHLAPDHLANYANNAKPRSLGAVA